MTGEAADRQVSEVPPDIAARIVGAMNRSPHSVVTVIGPDLQIRWLSASATWVTGTDPEGRRGMSSLERIHPDDVERLLHGLAQVAAARGTDTPTGAFAQPVRYRFHRFDGQWVVMEATIHNLLDDPEVESLVVISRPVSGPLDGVGHVVDLLVAEAPVSEVLTACAGLVPDYLGSAAVVALIDDKVVIGAEQGSVAERLARDERWWRPAVEAGEAVAPGGFAGLPEDLATRAGAEGFRSAWASPVFDHSSGEAIGCVVVFVRIPVERNIGTDDALRQTERLASLVIAEQRRHHELRRLATTDPLTRLGNRVALEERLDGEGLAVSLAVLDLDRFKPVNDTYGHEVGDDVLRVVAERLRSSVRDEDLVVRLGGDEFAVAFAPGTAAADVAAAAERLTHFVEAPIALAGRSITVGVSIGLATATTDRVLQYADDALYEMKRAKARSGLA